MNIDNPYFEGLVSQIYPSELQLNKANTSDTDDSFLALLKCILVIKLYKVYIVFVRRAGPRSAVGRARDS